MMSIEIPYRGAVIRFEPESATEMTEGSMATKLCAARRAIDQALDMKEKKPAHDLGVVDFDEGVGQHEVNYDQPLGFASDLVMPEYECQKRVRAAKITGFTVLDRGVAQLSLSLSAYSGATIHTREGWTERFRGGDEDLGYYVQYEDGFTSWSPTQAFEDGYHRTT